MEWESIANRATLKSIDRLEQSRIYTIDLENGNH